jgi:hypothetical protein
MTKLTLTWQTFGLRGLVKKGEEKGMLVKIGNPTLSFGLLRSKLWG